jgi:DNA-binding transcriptional ArsR family regulator
LSSGRARPHHPCVVCGWSAPTHAITTAGRVCHPGPGYPAELADLLGTSRQNLSNHLACLRGCGLVVAIPEGRRTRYELAEPRLAHALGDLLGLVLAIDPAACPAAAEDGCC